MVVTFNDPLLPLFFPLVAGLSIAGPAAASGFYELARRREEGRDSSWWHFLDPLNGRSRVPLATLTAGLAALFVGWLVVAYAIYGVTFGRTRRSTIAILARLFTTPRGVGADRRSAISRARPSRSRRWSSRSCRSRWSSTSRSMPRTAVRTSLAAVRKNPRETIGWGLRVAGLLLLGLLPAAIGLAVVLPWLGYATWHLYTRIVVR